MTEEEKKAIDFLYNLREGINEEKILFGEDLMVKCGDVTKNNITTILNLIEKQQKEIENLKSIEEAHRIENGKLREEIKELKKDISNMYDEEAVKLILQFDCGLDDDEISEILELEEE